MFPDVSKASHKVLNNWMSFEQREKKKKEAQYDLLGRCPQVTVWAERLERSFSLFPPFPLPLSLFRCRQPLTPEHPPAFSGCLSWFFSSYFSPPPRPSLSSCHLHFASVNLSSSLRATLAAPPPPLPQPLWWRQKSNRRSICIYITHVMCSVVLWLGPNSMVSTRHFGNGTPVISSPHPKAHFTWNMSAAEEILMQPVRATIALSLPSSHFHHLTTKPGWHSPKIIPVLVFYLRLNPLPPP